MSSKKSKLLESAQKNILKGQYDRAVIEYRQLIELDPHDLRHRQKVAEVLTKANQKDEAIKEYTSLAKHYIDSIHYLKAIAVYKQIQKLDPTNPETSLILASLNEKQGLIGNATAEYATAVQIYETRGENLKALKALESIMSLDSGNSAVKLRIAEKYFTTGAEENSFNTFASLLSDLKERNDENGFNLIAERAFTLFGDKAETILGQTSTAEVGVTLHVEIPPSTYTDNLTDLPDTLHNESDTAGVTSEFTTAPDLSSDRTEAEIYEEIDYIEDILPIDDDDQHQHPRISESGDEWEEEIDLISFAPLDGVLNAEPEILEELTTDDEFYELELELEDEPSLETGEVPNIPLSHADETFDLGKDLSIFADAIDFDLFSSQTNDTTFDITNSGFKKSELDNEDAESHYSLGLAYKEMGLFDEAIGEFLIASRSRSRKIDSLILQGVCLREIGSLAKAVEILSDTLKNEEITEDEDLGIQYEIALCHEASEAFAEARIMLADILKARPTYNDVATRLKNLPV